MGNIFQKFQQCYIIAEIGVNHNGSIGLAKEMVLLAKNAGANAVKFQTFLAKNLVSPGTPKVKYQLSSSDPDETHYQMIERLELSYEDHYELFNFCNELNIDFISTPYDVESAKFLQKLGVKYFKTASADIVDLLLHEFIASTKIPTIIATGMATLGEIERAIQIYDDAQSSDLVLLHCVSNYPCSHDSINMRSMSTLGVAFDLPVGYSDHSEGDVAAILSIALDAKVVEKHFTSNKNFPGPDQAASSSPEEFASLVKMIRLSEKILGRRKKIPQEEEGGMAQVSRKSICLSRAMEAGEVIALGDIGLIRPGDGLQANLIPFIIGKKIRKAVPIGHRISLADFE